MVQIRTWAIVLLIVGVGLGLFSSRASERFPFKLGLDLAGGALLTYEADVSDTDSAEIPDAMNALRDVVERRVNLFGVSEPVVQVETARVSGTDRHRLIVELPGVTDVDEAIKQLGETPLLEFKLRNDTVAAPHFVVDESGNAHQEESRAELDDLYDSTGLTGRYLKRAQIQFGGGGHTGLTNAPIVAIEFDSEGADLFETITREHIGEALAVFLDGVPITEPIIQSVIISGQAVITGNFTPEEARDLARDLNFGALPVPVELVSTQTVGASLGADTVAAGSRAAFWGLGLVALFMILWYRLPGLVAVVALGFYVALMLALFKLIPVTLTAAGLAGFILSIGMAVDANILIFERFKEELRAGKATLPDSIREGFRRAWLSIRDGNLTSIFTAIILFYTTTSLVKGFALTFGLGVLLSMISAIAVTRTLLLAVSSDALPRGLFGSGFSK